MTLKVSTAMGTVYAVVSFQAFLLCDKLAKLATDIPVGYFRL